MTKFAATETRPDPRLARFLWQTTALAALPWFLASTIYGSSAGLGRGFAWGVLVPAISLLVLHRHALRALWMAAPSAAVRRRASGQSGQARRASQRPRHRRQSPRAA